MLGEKIKTLRKEKSITQVELAKNIGVSTSMVGMYETNARKPSYQVLTKISNYFDVSTDYLLGKDISSTSHNAPNEDIITQNTVEPFETAEEAMQFILKQPSIMGFGGFDTNKMSNDEIIEFANELLNLLKMLGPKYNK